MFLPFSKCGGAFVHRFFHSPYTGFAHYLGPTEITSAVPRKFLPKKESRLGRRPIKRVGSLYFGAAAPFGVIAGAPDVLGWAGTPATAL
jgi:hypothetical protein